MLTIDPDSGIRADQIVEIELGLRPSPAGSGELLLQTEGPDTLLVLLLVDQDYQPAGPAIVTLVGCQQSVFGYPNDEPRWADPRLRDHGYGFFEITESPWPRRLDTYNRHAFPDSATRAGLRHLLVACHESLGEFLAEDIRVELWRGTFEDALREALRRVLR